MKMADVGYMLPYSGKMAEIHLLATGFFSMSVPGSIWFIRQEQDGLWSLYQNANGRPLFISQSGIFGEMLHALDVREVDRVRGNCGLGRGAAMKRAIHWCLCKIGIHERCLDGHRWHCIWCRP